MKGAVTTSELLAAALAIPLADEPRKGELGLIDRFNVVTSPMLQYAFPQVARRQKSRGNRMQRQRRGNKPGKYTPHQGKKEMARRVRNIALGRYNKEQLA